MTDTNRPHHWQVIDTRTWKVVADNLSHANALAYCSHLEPHPETTFFRYVMEPVREAEMHFNAARCHG